MIWTAQNMRCVLLTTTMLAAPCAPAWGQGTAADAATGANAAAVPDRVVVTGYRRSLAEALAVKQDYVGVVDAIVAEDIGKFPQSNLSEAIQRISGVQIRRDFAGGVGNEISIRGLPPEYTQVTINGQSAPTNSDSRSFNFNVLPAELFRSVTVYKSPTAALDEGGLGGVVALETIRPLDLGDRTAIASVEGIYNDITDELTPRITATVGGALNNRFGVVLGGNYSKLSAASQSYDSVRWTRRDFDVEGDGTAEFEDVFLMDLPRFIHQQQNVERLSVTGRAEYRVNDNLTLLADALYADNSQNEDRLTPIWFFDGGSGIRDIAVAGGAVEYVSYDDVLLRSENNTATRDTQTYKAGLAAELNFGDWQGELFLDHSQNDQDAEDFRYYADNRAPVAYDIRQDDNYFTITTPTNIADPAAYTMSEARHYFAATDDMETSLGVDFGRGLSSTLRLDLGAKFRTREKARQRFYTRIRNIGEPFAPVAMVFDSFLTDVDRGLGAPTAFAAHDFDAAYERYGSRLDLSNAEEPNNAFNVVEEVLAGYAMLTLDRGPLLVNGGVRLINTQVTSEGVELDEVTDTSSARSVESEYFDALPSLSVRYEVASDLYLRAAAARVLTRPSLADLAAYRVIDDVDRTISAKNPDLDPFRANQFDAAVEWYFQENGLLSAGYFYKDIESFIGTESRQVEHNGQTYTLTQPVNRNQAVIQGFELGYQQPFTFLPGPFDGFGVVANYTYTDSSYEEQLDDGAITYGLPENSKHSYNLIAYYEDDRVSVRLAHNFRSEFLREVPNEQDGLKYRDDVEQTDLSTRFNLTPAIQLTADVLNLFDTRSEEYVFDPRLTDGYFVSGRTFQFGVRASF